jgi:hypothetical protein
MATAYPVDRSRLVKLTVPIELLRARINTRVFAFVASHEFARSDFPASGVSTHRIAQPIIAELLARCLLPEQDILDCAVWMRDLAMRHGAPSRQARGGLSRRGGGVGGGQPTRAIFEAGRSEMAASGLAARS